MDYNKKGDILYFTPPDNRREAPIDKRVKFFIAEQIKNYSLINSIYLNADESWKNDLQAELNLIIYYEDQEPETDREKRLEGLFIFLLEAYKNAAIKQGKFIEIPPALTEEINKCINDFVEFCKQPIGKDDPDVRPSNIVQFTR